VGIIYHAYTESRSKLERRNVQLERTVELEQTHSQQQGQELEKAREIQEGLLPKKIPQVRRWKSPEPGSRRVWWAGTIMMC